MKLGVVFLKHVRPYNTNDHAGFEPKEAHDLVKRELARWDERVNPDGKPLAHEDLDEDIRKHRESIVAADLRSGLTTAQRQLGTPVAAAVPEASKIVEKSGRAGK
jgi:hypothetical protein